MPSLNTGNAILSNPIKVDSSYNVGIGGAASGSFKLQVTGTTNLTGALSGTSATFSSSVSINSSAVANYDLNIYNTIPRIQLQNPTSGTTTSDGLHIYQSGSDSYILNKEAANLYLGSNNGINLTIASTGAATFSSSVTAGGGNSPTLGFQLTTTTGSSTPRITSDSVNATVIRTGANGSPVVINNFANSAELVRFADGGNVGIGNNNPTYKLDIAGTTGATPTMRISATYNGGGLGLIHLTSDGSEGGTITFEKSSGTAQKYKLGCSNTNQFFIYNETGGNQPFTITSGGDVGIGNTAFSSTRLTVTGKSNTGSDYSFVANNASNGNLFWVRNDGVINTGTSSGSPYNNTSANVANLYVSAGGTLERGTASSMRFKENILEWDGNGLNTILALKPTTFTYKESYFKHPERVMLGLIAEEVAEVCPYLADYENEDGSGQVENVRYANIVVPLIKAIQEMNQTIQNQQQQINSLINR